MPAGFLGVAVKRGAVLDQSSNSHQEQQKRRSTASRSRRRWPRSPYETFIQDKKKKRLSSSASCCARSLDTLLSCALLLQCISGSRVLILLIVHHLHSEYIRYRRKSLRDVSTDIFHRGYCKEFAFVAPPKSRGVVVWW